LYASIAVCAVCLLVILLLTVLYTPVIAILALFARRKAKPKGDKPPTPSITMLIPAHNEALVIAQKIENSLALDYDRTKLEIIVLDDHSDDDTVAIAQKYTGRISVLPIQERRGKIGALNEGIKQAHGQFILITDADVMLTPGSIHTALQHFTDSKVGGVTGIVSIANTGAGQIPQTESVYWIDLNRAKLLESRLDTTIFHGPFMLIRKEALGTIDTGAGVDDVEISYAMRRKGYRIVADPNIVVHENSPTTWKQFISQKRRRAVTALVTTWKNRDFLLNPRYGAFGLFVVPFKQLFLYFTPILLLLLFAFGALLVWLLSPIALPILVGAGLLLALAGMAISPSLRGRILYLIVGQVVLLLTLWDVARKRYRTAATWEPITSVRAKQS
jgi:cellulose synthase/poly-beta-1,6-N-acetylglucosamine synthase-like glycosyltransferase